MKNYIIPYKKRFTKIAFGDGHDIETLMCVDNIGLCVIHKKNYTPTDDDVRRHLIGLSDTHEVIIQANSLQEALQEFMEWPQCKIGIKAKAFELLGTERHPVKEYAGCKWMLLKNWIHCQRYAEPGEVDSMVCILDGLSEPPEDCPIKNQMNHKGWRDETVQIGEVWVRQYSPLVKEMEPMINGIKARKIHT